MSEILVFDVDCFDVDCLSLCLSSISVLFTNLIATVLLVVHGHTYSNKATVITLREGEREHSADPGEAIAAENPQRGAALELPLR